MIKFYIDPGTGALLVNLIIAIGTSIIFYFRSLFFWLFNISNSKLNIVNPKISLFSEGEKYWTTFKPIINSFIKNKIHFNYYTMSFKDPALLIENDFIKSKYIGNGYLGFYRFSKIKSDALITTRPNIGNKDFPLKKPLLVKDLIHVYHSIIALPHYKIGALDNYDSVIIGGDFQIKSIRELERLRGLKEKNIYKLGIPYLDELNKNKKNLTSNKKTILIASSWGNKGCFKTYGTSFIDKLLSENFNVIIRPHPHSYIHETEFINGIKKKFSANNNVIWDEKNSPSSSMNKSNILISDSSSIRFDFSFIYQKPVITLKIKSPKMVGFENQFIESSWEEESERILGPVIDMSKLYKLNEIVKETLINFDPGKLNKFREVSFYNFSNSGNLISNFFSKKYE